MRCLFVSPRVPRALALVLLLSTSILTSTTILHARLESSEKQAVEMVRSGNVEGALAMCLAWDLAVGSILAEGCLQGDQTGGLQDVLQRYTAYAKYAPFINGTAQFGHLPAYIDLLKKAGGTTKVEYAAQTLASIESYQSFLADMAKGDRPLIEKALEGFLTNHPRSLLCPYAVLAAIAPPRVDPPPLSEEERRTGQFRITVDEPKDDPAARLSLYDKYLKMMRAAKVPPHLLAMVTWKYYDAFSGVADPPDAGQRLYLLLETGRLVDSESLHCRFLLDAMRTARETGDAESLQLAKQLGDELIQIHPHSAVGERARLELVRCLTVQGKCNDALRLIQQYQKEYPATDYGPHLFAVAEIYRGGKNTAQFLSILNIITTEHPRSMFYTWASIETAGHFARQGDEEQAFSWYIRTASFDPDSVILPPDSSHLHRFDFVYFRSEAAAYLGKYYIRKENWPEALKWWQKHRPAGRCGNGYVAMENEGAYYRGLCLLKMGKTDEALAILEPWVLKWHLETSHTIPILLTDYYRAEGKLDEFEARMKQAVETEKYNTGGKIALKYISILRLANDHKLDEVWACLKGRPIDALSREMEKSVGWETFVVVQQIIAMPEIAQPFLLKRLREGNTNDAIWAAALLGKMRFMEAIPAIQNRISGERNYRSFKDYCYALTLFGPDVAAPLLHEYANSQSASLRTAAADMLNSSYMKGEAPMP